MWLKSHTNKWGQCLKILKNIEGTVIMTSLDSNLHQSFGKRGINNQQN